MSALFHPYLCGRIAAEWLIKMTDIKRGEIYYADLSPVSGSEQGGFRPVIILQNDMGNKYSPTMIVAPLTTAPKKAMPTHVILDYEFLETASIVLLEQIRTIDQLRLSNYLGQISAEDMKKIDRALGISLGL